MYKFIAVLLARGVVAKGFPVRELWNKEWGPSVFPRIMSRNRFNEMKRFIRFDDKETRRRRLRHDRFALMSEVWERFTKNCKRCFVPNAYLTIDEQLYPTKVRCRFLQFMPSKPDKYGIKFWVLVDSVTNYIVNTFPYLGKDDQRPQNESLPEYVVKKLMDDFIGKGYNITMDNFFTSKSIADYLYSKKTSILGTIRSNRRELPADLQDIMKRKQLYETFVAKSNNCILTSYKCKKTKSVSLLSTLHQSVEYEGIKKKPTTIIDYNKTKFGVDVVDQMTRLYTCKLASRRWPLQVKISIRIYITCI